MPGGFRGQDSGQPWFIFWLLHSLEVCNASQSFVDADMKSRCIAYLRKCWNKNEGGFSGAPGLMTHLASTYAGIMALCNLNCKEAWDIVDVDKMYDFLLSCKNNLDLTHE